MGRRILDPDNPGCRFGRTGHSDHCRRGWEGEDRLLRRGRGRPVLLTRRAPVSCRHGQLSVPPHRGIDGLGNHGSGLPRLGGDPWLRGLVQQPDLLGSSLWRSARQWSRRSHLHGPRLRHHRCRLDSPGGLRFHELRLWGRDLLRTILKRLQRRQANHVLGRWLIGADGRRWGGFLDGTRIDRPSDARLNYSPRGIGRQRIPFLQSLRRSGDLPERDRQVRLRQVLAGARKVLGIQQLRTTGQWKHLHGL